MNEQEPADHSSAVVVIADELTAAGYRLAGAHAVAPAPRDVAAALEAALTSATLVLITDSHAKRVAPERLAEVLRATSPLVQVVCGAGSLSSPGPLSAVTKRQLGVELQES